MQRPARVALGAGALFLASLSATTGPVLAAPCDTASTALQNGGFEVPLVPAGTFAFFDAVDVPPWQTTDTEGKIEIWGAGFGGVPADEGVNFAEINANSPGTLYQDVVSTPGQTMTWTLRHRGRGGDDVMRVLIGDATTADVTSDSGWDYFSPDLTDGVAGWGSHTDQYVVPAGQTCTRFAFRAISTGSGNDSVGNFLDDVSFAIAIPPTPTPPPNVTIPPTSTGLFADRPRRNEPTLAIVLLALSGLGAGSWLLGRRAGRGR
ncbi:MAG: hypothetical protein ABI628_07985 [Chloroflexota bacterium]